MTANRLVSVLASVFLLAVAAPARADLYEFNTIQRGWYNDANFNDPTDKNYIVGQIDVTTFTQGFHNFFAFAPLGALNGPIVSIDLILFEPLGGFTSTQASELYSLAGFGGNVANLIAGTDATGYADLASGTVYGGGTVTAAADGTFIDFSLNAAAIAAISAAAGNFAIGGQLTSIPGIDTDTRFIFGATAFESAADGQTFLRVVTSPVSQVPEPGSILLFVTGIGALLLVRRKTTGKS